jgi:hypothetical protein
MVHLLSDKPESPFTQSEMYPAFAAFAAYYGEPREEQRWCSLKKLRDGEPLKNLVDINDRAFLFFLYVTFCAHLKSQEQRGWYFSADATTVIRHIVTWMEEEDEDDDAHSGLDEKIADFLGPLNDALDSAVTAVYMEGDADKTCSDDDC